MILLESLSTRPWGLTSKRQNLIAVLKEEDVGKERRAQMVKESTQLDAEWVAALVELRRVMDECSVLLDKKDA